MSSNVISVVTIVKDNEKLLPRAIDSVLQQTFQNFEYLIVNDGSTDRTGQIIDEFARNDERVKPIHFKKNMGRAFARNTGMDAAEGSYLLFLDADDYLREGTLKILHEVGERYQSDIVFGHASCFDIHTNERVAPHYTTTIIDHERHNFTLNDYLPLVYNHMILGRLYRLKMIRDNDIRFSDKRKNGEDVSFAFYTTYYANNISMVPHEDVYCYSLGNFLGTATVSKLFDARDNLLETIDFSRDHGRVALQRKMWEKGAIFVSDLKRAEKVFGEDDQQFIIYIESLRPLVEGVDEKILASLNAYQKDFVHALLAGEYVAAFNLWKWPKLMQEKISALESKLDNIDSEYSHLPGYLETLYRSKLWRITAPLRYIAEKQKNISSKLQQQGRLHSTQPSKISVIIPIYNVEEYLRPCLDSVLEQTHKNIEIICVNDCSPDNSDQILTEYARKDSRIILKKHDKNKGLSAARNTGMKISSGEYLYFLDSDDLLADRKALELLYQTAIEDNADEVIGGILKWNEETGEKFPDWHENYLRTEERGKELQELPQLWANVVAWNKLLKKDLLENNDIAFNEDLKKNEDNPFSCKVHIHAKKISIVPTTTYTYRHARTGSIMSSEKKSDAFFRCMYCEEIFAFIESEWRFHKFRKMYYPMYSRQLLSSAEIISRFSPTKEEKLELMKRWREVISFMRPDFPGVPDEISKVYALIFQGEYELAWEQAITWKKNERSLQLYSEPKNGQSILPLKQKLSNLRAGYDQKIGIYSTVTQQINDIVESKPHLYVRNLQNALTRKR